MFIFRFPNKTGAFTRSVTPRGIHFCSFFFLIVSVSLLSAFREVFSVVDQNDFECLKICSVNILHVHLIFFVLHYKSVMISHTVVINSIPKS